jgi:nickel-dependent lactate racemase
MGDPVAAHRALTERARDVFRINAPRAPVVVVADRPPVTRSLYQASKMLPPAGAILSEGGVVVCVAECDAGIGPLERVNQGIYELGVKRHLPAGHRVLLVSALGDDMVRQSYAEPAASLDDALHTAFAYTGADRGVLLWRAGEAIVEAHG